MLKFIVVEPFSLAGIPFNVGTAFLSGDIACILNISEEEAVDFVTELESANIIKKLGDYEA